jgi:hypothetical protein
VYKRQEWERVDASSQLAWRFLEGHPDENELHPRYRNYAYQHFEDMRTAQHERMKKNPPRWRRQS